MTRATRAGNVPSHHEHAPLLVQVFFTFNPGGAQTRFVHLANHFGTRLWHGVLAMDGNYACMSRLADETDVTPLPLLVRGARLPEWPRAFSATLSAFQPDHLTTHLWGTIEWAVANLAHGTHHIYMEDGLGLAEREDDFVVGTVVTLRPEKNFARLLRAFALVSRDLSCRLVMVGDGPEKPRLEKLAQKLGVSACLSFTRYIADTGPLYGTLDIFALTSDTEQMPYAPHHGDDAERA